MTAAVAREAVRVACDQCPFARTYTTHALADYHFPRHRCGTQLASAARTQRRLARAAASGEVRDCHCPRARHQHGTRNAYVIDRCRCRACRDANITYAATLTRQHLYGRRHEHRVPARETREHVQLLGEHGVSYKQVAILAGVSPTTLGTLLYGCGHRREGDLPRTVDAHFAARVLAVTADPLALTDGVYIDATTTIRRVQALVALGYSRTSIAHRLGIIPSNFITKTMCGRRVTAKTARAVRDLYDQLADTVPARTTHRERISYSRARHDAQRLHWLPPAAWDDIDTDPAPPVADEDPVDEVDDVAVERIILGDRPATVTRAELMAAIDRLAAAGNTAGFIADRVGLTRYAVAQICSRNAIRTGTAA